MKNKFFITLLLFFIPLLTQANDYKKLVEEGNAFYKIKDYEKAVQCYESVLANNYHAEELYYNLGNSYFRLNKYGLAILNYERALRINPNDKDAIQNLKIANTRIKNKTIDIPELFISQLFKSAINTCKYNTWATFCIIFVSIACVISCIFFLSKKYNIKKWSFYSGVIAVFIAIVFIVFAYVQYSYSTNKKYAIVIKPTIIIKNSPDENSSNKYTIYEGAKVYIEDSIPLWAKIKLQNGDFGWVDLTDIEII